MDNGEILISAFLITIIFIALAALITPSSYDNDAEPVPTIQGKDSASYQQEVHGDSNYVAPPGVDDIEGEDADDTQEEETENTY